MQNKIFTLIMFISFILFFTSTECGSAEIEGGEYYHFSQCLKRERAIVYNALNLTNTQIKKLEEISLRYEPVYNIKAENLEKEVQRLKSMKALRVCQSEIYPQKNRIRKIEKDIRKIITQEDKEFRKYLNHNQREKYDMIAKLKKHDLKHNISKKDFRKSNPQMSEFGCPGCKCSYLIGESEN